MHPILRPFLAHQGVVVLDGGLATELEARGETLDDPLWSAAVMLDRPERIGEVHRAYLVAGADCILTASYQASLEGLERRGLTTHEAESVLRRSVEIATAARDEFWAARPAENSRVHPLVAASVGPYGAFLADGSEYRGDYDLDVGALIEFHRRRLEVLVEAGPDLVACETIPSFTEARALVELLGAETGPPAWLSFSCRDGVALWDGTPLTRALEECEPADRIVAVGVNCTAPEHVASLLRAARSATDLPLVAYPNSGESWDPRAKRWLPGGSGGDALVDRCELWRDLGARLIGGCCRTGPAEIERLRARLLRDPSQDALPSGERSV